MSDSGSLRVVALVAVWSSGCLAGCKGADCAEGERLQCAVPATGHPGVKTCSGGTWSDCVWTWLCSEGDSKECKTADGADGVSVCTADGQWGTCRPPGACLTGRKQSCRSDCGTGEETCVDEVWDATTCTAPQPEEERADGVDNDCDGEVDEDCCGCRLGQSWPCYTGPANTEDVGVCRGGSTICISDGHGGTQHGPCTGEVKPARTEDCTNTLDDDCDGMVNQGCECKAGATASCGSDVGTCKKGHQVCEARDGGLWWSLCVGAVGPAAEKVTGCDGKDNDCNGVVDDRLDPDANEPNDACASVHFPFVVTNQQGGAVKVDKLTLYPTGDVDIVEITALERDETPCGAPPARDQCHRLFLTFSDPAVSGLAYQYTVMGGRCGQAPASPLKAGQAPPFSWPGTSSTSDDKDFWIKVEPTATSKPSFTCVPYTIEARMETQCVHCCTLVACRSSADCTAAGCGACDLAKGICGR